MYIYIYVCSIHKQTDLRVHRTASFSPSTLKTKPGRKNWSQEIFRFWSCFQGYPSTLIETHPTSQAIEVPISRRGIEWLKEVSCFWTKNRPPHSCHWKDLLKLSMASQGRGSMSGQCWAFRTFFSINSKKWTTRSLNWLGRSASPRKWSSKEWVVSQLATLCSVRR